MFRRQGYSGTGLNQVLAAGEAPKGSMYFHFPGGKEQLATEAVQLAGGELGVGFTAVLDTAPDARSGIVELGRLLAGQLEASAYREGCPVATVALEEAAESEAIRGACETVYDAWSESLASRLRSWGVPDDQADPLAALVLSSLQGALLVARVRRDAAVIEEVAHRVGEVVHGATHS